MVPLETIKVMKFSYSFRTKRLIFWLRYDKPTILYANQKNNFHFLCYIEVLLRAIGISGEEINSTIILPV